MKRLLTVGTTIGALALASNAKAQNLTSEPFFYSDDAAITAGAVGATTRDAGAVWYNPAGLGGETRGQLDLSASAFGIRIRNVPTAISTKFPNGTQVADLNGSDIFSAPHAISLVRKLNDRISLGGGLFVTDRDVRTGTSDTEIPGPAFSDASAAAKYRQRVDITIDTTRYHFGPAIGIAATDNFRVGVSLFGTYAKQSGFAQFLIGEQAAPAAGPESFFIMGQNRRAFTYFGIQPQAGIQWEPGAGVTLSLLVRSPEVIITTSADGANVTNQSIVFPGRNPVQNWAIDKASADLGAGQIAAPFRAILGVGKQVGERSWISAEVDFKAPFSNDLYDQHAVVNGRIGGRFKVSDKLSLGGGLYTDFSGIDLGDDFGSEKVDEFGGTFGIELRTPLSLEQNPSPDALVLSTTLAVKYGVGIGQFRAIDLDLTSDGNPPQHKVDVTYHTILPYIGSSILF